MRYRLRTLMILLGTVPPLLWAAYVVLKPPGRLLLFSCFILAFLACVPYAIVRLKALRLK